MYTISHGIYAILDIQFFYKSRLSVHIMYTISCGIYAILDIQIFYKSRCLVHIMYTITHLILLFWKFNISANQENPYI